VFDVGKQGQVRLFVTGLLLACLVGCSESRSRVVLYCAQDQEFAERLLEEFRQKTGLSVAVKYDTEKNKSVSLYTELVREKDRPRCDVFWNNEMLMTMQLQRLGMLEPYDSPSVQPYPSWARAADHTWTAFAQRARVLVVNTNLVPEAQRPSSLLRLTSPSFRGQVVMAKPLHGTSMTQAACLFEVLGTEKAKAYYHELKVNDVQIAPGNKQVAEWVGAGRTPGGVPVALGVTDTDDALAEVKSGRPVALVFPDAMANGRMGTIFIPNSICLLKGSPNPEGARRLADFLLSAEVEARLAEADSHQIPVNPKARTALPPEMRTPDVVHAMQVDWQKAADLWKEAQDFLTQEFTSD
jgi:iron(III) transport system substrate-binding protein